MRIMASLTIRKLDEALKQRLRLRAAQNGRSMEDEARTILRRARRTAAAPSRRAARRQRRVAEQPADQPQRAGDAAGQTPRASC